MGHVAHLRQKVEGGAVDGIFTGGGSGIVDEFWGIQVFGLGGVKGGRGYVLGVVDLHGRGLRRGQIENKRRTCSANVLWDTLGRGGRLRAKEGTEGGWRFGGDGGRRSRT